MSSLLWIGECNSSKFSLKENERLSILSLNCANDICVELCGEGAVFEYRSLSIFSDGKTEQKINVIHKAPRSRSFLFARHILSGSAKAEFRGTIEACEGCKDIKSRQLAHSILLSPSAKAVSKPELKIHCDEVECSHGSACGALDEESLFYLQSRGLGLAEARRILLSAFAAEIAREHPDEEQKSKGLGWALSFSIFE